MDRFLSAGWEELVRRHPEEVFFIRRLISSDRRFQAICADIGEALIAVETAERKTPPDKGRVDEFRAIAQDLFQEALDYVNSHTESQNQ